MLRTYLGDTEIALQHLEQAARLSPIDLQPYNMSHATALAHFVDERYFTALEWCKKTLRDRPIYVSALRVQTACLGLLGLESEARASAEQLLAVNPSITISGYRA